MLRMVKGVYIFLMTAVAVAYATGKPTIQHVVVLQLENRAFDHMLGWLNRNNTEINGLTGNECNPVDPADPSSQLVCVDDEGAYVDPSPGHEVGDTAQQIFGVDWWAANVSRLQPERMNGFVANAVNNTQDWAQHVMKCFAPEHVPVISTLAMEFTLVDQFFAAIPGPTFPNRLMTQSATTWGYGTNDAARTLAGWPQKSIFQALNEVNATWRVYFEEAATAWLFQDMRTGPNLGRFKWMSEFAADAAAGNLPQFTYLDPSYFSVPGIVNATDQHPSHDVLDGERLIKTVYEALRASPLWNNTVFILTYDEHGGFYDHVSPPVEGVPNPDGISCRDCSVPFNFDRLGVRVPLIVASPWVQKGRVIHTAPANVMPTPLSQMELSSIPATLHRLYNTTSFLSKRDAWATPLNWIWEQSGLTSPRTNCPVLLPAVPEQTPSQAGNVPGQAPISHLHKDLLYMIQGAFAGVRKAQHGNALLHAAGVSNEGEAGTWVRRLVSRGLEGASGYDAEGN